MPRKPFLAAGGFVAESSAGVAKVYGSCNACAVAGRCGKGGRCSGARGVSQPNGMHECRGCRNAQEAILAGAGNAGSMEHMQGGKGLDLESQSAGGAVQAFVEKESGPEGAEVPSRAAAGRGEAGVHMSAKHFWQELGGAMGVHVGGLSTC